MTAKHYAWQFIRDLIFASRASLSGEPSRHDRLSAAISRAFPAKKSVSKKTHFRTSH
ncbi:hypothetical protein D3C85_609060 [compost metagenome]